MQKNPFIYVPPTVASAKVHNAIKAAEEEAMRTFKLHLSSLPKSLKGKQMARDLIGEAMEDFYTLVENQVPASADKSAALRCIRLAALASNEIIFGELRPDQVVEVFRQLKDNLRAARWQASAAVALAQ